MKLVNLNISDDFYPTFLSLISDYKSQIKVIESYDKDKIEKNINQFFKDYNDNNVTEIKDINKHISNLKNEIS